MNFKKLSKEKKNHLVLVGLVTLMLLVGLGYGLIRFQLEHVKNLAKRKLDVDQELKLMTKAIQSSDSIQARLAEASKELAAQEDTMASGDKLAWLVSSLKTALRQHPKVDVPDFSTILEGDCSLLAKFPYSQVLISIKGTGQYHDIGRFIAQLENDRPHFRVLNVEIEPSRQGPGNDREKSEKLSFKCSIAALVKPG